jgi:TRAP-type C4-dicarboxylate transport system substrate-binding protein
VNDVYSRRSSLIRTARGHRSPKHVWDRWNRTDDIGINFIETACDLSVTVTHAIGTPGTRSGCGRIANDQGGTRMALRTIGGALVAATLGAAFATPAMAQKQTWNINIFGPKRAVTAGIEAIAEHFGKVSGGALEVKLVYGGALGPERQIPEGIKSGGYEGGLLCVGYYPNKMPLTTVMELPFLAPANLAARAKVDQALLDHPDIVKEMAGRWGMKALATAFLPPFEFMGNKRIAKVEDMKGVKMRISGLNAQALQAFGAVPTIVTPPEGYTALERGTIDSFGFPYTYAFGAYKMYEVSKYVTEVMAMGGFLCFIGLSANAWDKAPAPVKAALGEARKMSEAALLKAYAESDAKWRPIFAQRTEMTQFPAAERQKLVGVAGKLWDKWVADQEAAGRPGKKILDFVKAEVAKLK